MLLVLAGIFLAIAGVCLVDAATLPARRRRVALARLPSYAAPGLWVSRAASIRRARELRRARSPRSLTQALARVALKASGVGSLEKVQSNLIAAGLADRLSATKFLASKMALLLGGIVLGAVVGGAAGGGSKAVLLALVLGIAGLVLPSRYVTQRANRRRAAIRASLPTAFDILSISVEAGLSLDSALTMLTERLHGPLADELRFTMAELEVGESRREALRKLADRVSLPEITSFANAIQQGDRFGISLGGILRTVAADARRKRQAEAEERANKMQVKILFPVVAFTLPSIFLLVVVPGLLGLKDVLQ